MALCTAPTGRQLIHADLISSWLHYGNSSKGTSSVGSELEGAAILLLTASRGTTCVGLPAHKQSYISVVVRTLPNLLYDMGIKKGLAVLQRKLWLSLSRMPAATIGVQLFAWSRIVVSAEQEMSVLGRRSVAWKMC